MGKESLSRIKSQENMWPDKDLLKNVDIYDFSSLMQNLNEFNTSYVGMGYYGIVFRIRRPQYGFDATLKLMRFNSSINAQDLALLFKESHISQNIALIRLFILTDFRNRIDYLTKDLAFAQSAGHVFGNMIAPKHIDAPIALWTKENSLIGYSLPYLAGIPERISKNVELNTMADQLEKRYNLYLGSRGSKNAIILNDGSKRFIDVSLKNTNDFSIPNL